MTKEFPVIKTQRLLLRQFVDSDLVNVFKGLSHPDIIKYYGVSYNVDLLKIVKQPGNYQKEAVEAATQILKVRHISQADIYCRESENKTKTSLAKQLTFLKD